jgi:hypothetical protein
VALGVAEHPVVRADRKAVVGEPAPPADEHCDGCRVEVDAAQAGAGLDAELRGAPPTFCRVREIDRRRAAVSRSRRVGDERGFEEDGGRSCRKPIRPKGRRT